MSRDWQRLMLGAVCICAPTMISPMVAAADDCAALEGRANSDQLAITRAADSAGAFRRLAGDAQSGARLCPDSAQLWYLAALTMQLDPASSNGEDWVTDAAKRFPNSAPIATVVALRDQTKMAAQKAFDLNSAYRPARRLLALALAREGLFDQALSLLPISQANSADRFARASVLLTAGKSKEAIKEANVGLKPLIADDDQPVPSDMLIRDGYETLGLARLAQGDKKQARKDLQTAAALGSAIAKEALEKFH